MSFAPGSLFASLVVSSIGFVAFSYGRKQRRLPQSVAGIALMAFPYFVPTVLPMLLIATALLAAMALAIHLGL
jgi:hypothetical protein